MKLPDKIIKHRRSNGWSQEAFAERLNVSRQAVSRWENASALPDAQNILQISKLFHVTTDYLLNDDQDSDRGIPLVRPAVEKTDALSPKKRQLHLIAALALTAASLCWIFALSTCTSSAARALLCFTLSLCACSTAAQFVLYFKKR